MSTVDTKEESMSKQSAQIIREFLYRNSISITEFAKVTDLSRWTIHKYLNGANIQPKAARKIEKNVLETYRIFFPHEKLLS